jgi:hypothetical protein
MDAAGLFGEIIADIVAGSLHLRTQALQKDANIVGQPVFRDRGRGGPDHGGHGFARRGPRRFLTGLCFLRQSWEFFGASAQGRGHQRAGNFGAVAVRAGDEAEPGLGFKGCAVLEPAVETVTLMALDLIVNHRLTGINAA